MKSLIAILLIALLESLTYVGFFRVHFAIPSLFIYLVLGYVFFFLGKPTHFPAILTKVFTTLMLGISLAYVILKTLESLTYDNFVFTHLHINMTGLGIFVLFSIIGYFYLVRGQLVEGALAALLVFNLAGLTPFLIKSLRPILVRPFATHDEKMISAYGDFYVVMQQVKALTPESATIVIPPQGAPWVDEGNTALVRRFLYPRQIIHIEEMVANPDSTYVLISYGNWPEEGSYTHGWPKIDINSSKVWRLYPSNKTTQEFDGKYNPEDKWDWGLIEVLHE